MRRSGACIVMAFFAFPACGGRGGNRPDASTPPPDAGGPQDADVPTDSGAGPTIPTDPGPHDISIRIEGATRWFILHVPRGYDGTRPVPLVFMFHGGGGGMRNMYETRQDAVMLAEERTFLLVVPNGQNAEGNLGSSIWNAGYCCGPAGAPLLSDVEFVRAMVRALTGALNVDAQRIHATGFSNGAILSHKLAAELDR